MTLTLPQSLGGIRTYDSLGAVILRSTDDLVEVFVAFHMNATATIEGATTINDTTTINDDLIVNADTQFNGNLAVTGTTALGGLLTLTANLNANGFQILGGKFVTEGGAVYIEDDFIAIAGGGFIQLGGFSMGGSGTTLTVSALSANFAGEITCVDLIETSLAETKIDLRLLDDPMSIVNSLTAYDYQPAGGGIRMAGFVAEEVESAGHELLLGRDSDGALTGVRYTRLVPIHNQVLRDLDARVRALEVSARSTR